METNRREYKWDTPAVLSGGSKGKGRERGERRGQIKKRG